MSRLVADYAVLAIVTIGLLYLLYWLRPFLWSALRTGRLPARGVTYDRHLRPVRFWFGVWFWLFCLALFLVSEYLLVYGVTTLRRGW